MYDRTLILVLFSTNDSPMNRDILKEEAKWLSLRTTVSRFVKAYNQQTTHYCELVNQDTLGGQLGQLTINSQLSIYGHCESMAIGGKPPIELAQYLHDHGFRSARNINLIACETSKDLGFFEHGSYAEEFLVAIRRVGPPHPTVLSVTGREGDVTIRAGDAYPIAQWGTKQVSGDAGDIPKGENKRVFH
jgi:hypothetical protein